MNKHAKSWAVLVAAPVVICAALSLLTPPAVAGSTADTSSDNWTDVCKWTAEHNSDGRFVCNEDGKDGATDDQTKTKKKKKKSSSSSADGPKYPCTSYGDQEKTLALQALQAGHDICQVADLLNRAQPPDYISLPGDKECVCYPDGPYVGCREFYMAGPDDGSFTPDNYQTNANLWFAVSRCDPSCTDPKGCNP